MATHQKSPKLRPEALEEVLTTREEERPTDEENGSEERTGKHSGPPQAAVLYVETESERDLYDLISNLDDTEEVLLDIPEWKVRDQEGKVRIVQVLVRAMTADERINFLKVMQQSNVDLSKLYPDIAILCARHPRTKKPIWKPADRGMLLKRHGFAIERIAMCASQISGLSQEALNDLQKNLGSTRNSSATSN